MEEIEAERWTVLRSKVDTEGGKFRVQVPKRVRDSLGWKEMFGPGSLILSWVNADIPNSSILTNLGDDDLVKVLEQLGQVRIRGFL